MIIFIELREVGVKFTSGKVFKAIVLKFDYEVLTGNGSKAFLTPLATGHAYQGWNDRFLVPAAGVVKT